MVAKQKETAEQKLLKMIEASSGEGAVTTKTHQKVAKKQDALTLVRTSNKLKRTKILNNEKKIKLLVSSKPNTSANLKRT